MVGSDYFKDLPLNTRTTIVDGIIGEVLAKRAVDKQVNGGFNPEGVGFSQDDFARLDPEMQNDLIQDWLLSVEVWADMENNPVSKESARLMHESKVGAFTVEYATFPELP